MADPVRVAEDNFFATFRSLTSLIPGGACADDDGAFHLHTGARIPTFNLSVVARIPEDLPRFFETATAFHAEHESPVWMVAVREPDLERFAPAATHAGFTLADDEPFMLLEPLVEASVPAGLRVRPVEDMHDLQAHFDLVSRSFGMPMELIDMIISPALLNKAVTMFLGEVDGVPVTTSMLAVSETEGTRCAGIYNVGTLESYRRRGLGAAMTAYAATIGQRDHRCTVASLQSSPMGRSVYEAMGYREVTRWEMWAPPPDGAP